MSWISRSITVALLGLIFVELNTGTSVKRDRPRRAAGKGLRHTQTFNSPGRQAPGASIKTKRSNPLTGDLKTGGPGARNVPDNSPLLDFPDFQKPEAPGPLLDFPDPLEMDFKERSLTFDAACRTNTSLTLKEKAVKNIIRKHKPFLIHEVKTQNRILEQAIMSHFIQTVPIQEHQPMNSWKILEQSATLFQSFCKGNKHLPASFIPNALYAFKKLHYLTTPERTEYLGDVNFKWISATLSECSNGSKGFHFYQDQCHQDILAWKKEDNWLCTRWSDDFNLGVYDPLLDIIWHIYNGVYFYCRDYFQHSYWQLHTFAAVMMDLYSNAIKLRWTHQIQSEEFWTRILGPNFQAHARNIEKCTQATVESQEMQVMMPRYLSTASVRYSMAENNS